MEMVVLLVLASGAHINDNERGDAPHQKRKRKSTQNSNRQA